MTVSVNGDKIVEADETFTVSLLADSAQFNSETDATRAVIATGNLNGNASGDDSIATGFISNEDSALFTINSVAGAEAGGAMTFIVTLSNAVDVATSVDVTLANVTTNAGDHNGTSLTTLNFAAGETSQAFTVTPVDDAIVEADETFEISLGNVADGSRDVAASASAGIGTILNDNTDNVFREPVSTTSLFLPSRINTWSMSTARSIVSIRRWLTKSSSVGWQVTMRLA